MTLRAGSIAPLRDQLVDQRGFDVGNAQQKLLWGGVDVQLSTPGAFADGQVVSNLVQLLASHIESAGEVEKVNGVTVRHAVGKLVAARSADDFTKQFTNLIAHFAVVDVQQLLAQGTCRGAVNGECVEQTTGEELLFLDNAGDAAYLTRAVQNVARDSFNKQQLLDKLKTSILCRVSGRTSEVNG